MSGQFCAFKRGDMATWRNIVENNSSWLYTMCLRMLWNSYDAEEVVQECFLRAFKNRGQLKNLDHLNGWLRKICVRICLRKCKRNKHVSLDEAEQFLTPANPVTPADLAAKREEIMRVLQSLARLSPRQRGCLVLSAFEDLSMKEIAAAAGISEGSVKRYIFEARQFLNRYLHYE